jgi:uncharacterized membrane protein YoaK (UPF0700 family)
MHRTESPLIAVAVCLAGLAGFVDALAFTSLGGFFASFMSGNSTRLGVGLGTADTGVALTAGALILSFLSGVILSGVIVRAAGAAHKAAVMAMVTLLLFVAAAATAVPGPIVLLLLAAAMGCENGVFNRDGEVTVGVTYMTGSLVRMGQKLAGALMGDADRWGWVPYLALWLGFAAGAVCGAASQWRWGWDALWIAAVIATALTVALARLGRSGLLPASGAPGEEASR